MKPNRKKLYYFPERLKKRLAQIPLYPLTVVQAPSGFGKTTAVREYLRKSLPEGAQEYWYTCAGEPALQAWAGICDLLFHVDEGAANALLGLGMPTADTLTRLAPLIKGFQCASEMYLVIDGFQLVDCEIRHELINTFSMHKCPDVHMIFITQYLQPMPQVVFYNPNIHFLGPSAFFFDRESTAGLFRLQGIRLSEEELDSVCACTEGWAAAIRLMMVNFQQAGSFEYTADMDWLVEAAVWNRLTGEEREFLLTVSVTDGFTALQAARMTGRETLPENIVDLLRTSDFIRYFPQTGTYTIHRTLLRFLRNRFHLRQPEGFQRRILCQVGRCYALDAQLWEAARLFFAAKDFDAILSLPFDAAYVSFQREKGLIGFVLNVLDECPEETLLKYPFTLLVFLYGMILDGRMEDFQKYCLLTAQSMETNRACLGPAELRRLKGEFMALTSLTAHNDIRKLGKAARAALDLMGGPSTLLIKDMPWALGGTSILCLYWREPGTLDETLLDMEEWLPFYLKLTRGQGSGADSVLRAEALLMRGEDDQAEIFCHRALYEARSRQQISVCFCAETLLARIAILRGDTDGYWAAIGNIENLGKEDPHPYIKRMVDICMAAIGLAIRTTENFALWLCDLRSIERAVCAPAIPYVQVLYSYLLLSKRQLGQLYGAAQLAMERAGRIGCLFPQVYHLLFLATAKHNGGDDMKARAHLNQALALALPDRVYLPFAYHWKDLGGLLESIESPYEVFDAHCASACAKPGKSRASPMPSAVFYDRLGALKALCRRQENGMGAIKKAILKARSPLTPREREVALLAQNRLSNKEIASKLYISEKTIKTFLQSIYIKLDVHSKAELGDRKF